MTEVEPTLIESRTIDEEFPRTHRYPNAEALNEEQVRRRENDIKDLRDKYPTLPDAWIEMAWNFCELTPQEELDRIIQGKLWDKPSDVKRGKGGVIKNAITVEKPNDAEQTDSLGINGGNT